MGFTIASFHRLGKNFVTNEAFIISARMSAVCSILSFIKKALISSTPQAFVLMVSTVFLTSKPVISENLNLALQAVMMRDGRQDDSRLGRS